MIKKKKSSKEVDEVEKERFQELEDPEKENGGFPEKVDFKKFLGCGG